MTLREMKVAIGRWRLPLQALAVALLIVAIRVITHRLGLERISVSPLIATIVTANVFIVGFLLTGILADYKEGEKLPGDLSVSLGAIADECHLLWRHKQAPPARDGLRQVLDLTTSLRRWFCKQERTQNVMAKVEDLGDLFVALESFTQPNFIVRLKQEQSTMSRMLVRIHTIRETSFVSSGYIMAMVVTGLVLVGLLFLKIEPWYESVFLTGVIAWFLSYLLLLIRDLDNPFDYAPDGTARGHEVSLKPLEDLEAKLAREVASADSAPAPAASGEAARV